MREHKTFMERLAGTNGKVYYAFIHDEATLTERVLKDFPGFSVKFDDHLNFTPENNPGYDQHALYTIRYMPNTVRLPKHPHRGRYLDCVLVEDGKKSDIGIIVADSPIVVWRIRDFPGKAAQLAGFENKRHALRELSSMYKTKFSAEDVFSFFGLERFIPK